MVAPLFTQAYDELKALGTSVFGPMLNLARRPAPRETDDARTLRRLRDELAIRDAFTHYHYFYDAGDADAIAELFTEDAVLVNPRGTYVGRAAIRDNYGFLVSRPGPVFHYATNVLVRLDDDGRSAWLTSFLWCGVAVASSTSAPPDGINGGGGSYSIRWRKEDGAWRMAASRLAWNFTVGFGAPHPSTETAVPPVPRIAETSTQWQADDPNYAWPQRA